MTAMYMVWVTRCRVMPFTKVGNGMQEGEIVEATLFWWGNYM